MGVLRYTPEVCRSMTVKEAEIAIKGYMSSKGRNPKKRMTKNDALDIIARVAK